MMDGISKTRARDRGHIHIQVRLTDLNISGVKKELNMFNPTPNGWGSLR